MNRSLRLVSIAHSYVVALNRRLAHELQRVGSGRWQVTAVAPERIHSDFRSLPLERIPDEPCNLEAVPLHLSRFVHVMFYGLRLRDILGEPWDLVHCWEEPHVLSAAQVAWWSPRGAALVYRSFQNVIKVYPPPFSWFERLCVERCAGWVGSGEEVVKTLLARGYGRKPYRLIPLGVDLEVFHPDAQARAEAMRKLEWQEAGPCVVGYVGRLVPEKGLSLLMRVLDATAAPWRALIMGKGPMEGAVRRWSRRQGSRVRVLTEAGHSQVPSYLNAMDVLCVPSQTTPRWREQFGRVIIEAFACGVPVLGSDSGEIPHILGDAGVVVGEKGEAAWVEALSGLIESPARRREIAERGLEKARTSYSWPVIARSYLDFFQDLVEQRASARR